MKDFVTSKGSQFHGKNAHFCIIQLPKRNGQFWSISCNSVTNPSQMQHRCILQKLSFLVAIGAFYTCCFLLLYFFTKDKIRYINCNKKNAPNVHNIYQTFCNLLFECKKHDTSMHHKCLSFSKKMRYYEMEMQFLWIYLLVKDAVFIRFFVCNCKCNCKHFCNSLTNEYQIRNIC